MRNYSGLLKLQIDPALSFDGQSMQIQQPAPGFKRNASGMHERRTQIAGAPQPKFSSICDGDEGGRALFKRKS